MVARICQIALVFLIALKAGAAPETHQRYVGTLANRITQMQHLVKLDLIPLQKKEQLVYAGFLTLYLGNLNSKEYVTYHFDEGLFDLETGRLIFDQDDQAVSFIARRQGDEVLLGELRASAVGTIGNLELRKGTSVRVQTPLSPALGGEYRGTCAGKDVTLQIQTMRSMDDTVRVGNPFGAYPIRAQWAEPLSGNGCYGVIAPCVKYTYESGTYNFFSGELGLYGRVKNLKCSVTAGQMTCNGCTLKPAILAPAKQDLLFPNPQPFWTLPQDGGIVVGDQEFQGEYHGFLHHEYRDAYQNISLDIVDFPKAEDRKRNLMISAVAKLHFGDESANESLYYKFKQARFDLMGRSIVLANLERDTDALLILEEARNGTIKGSWFSMVFGRVGSFIVSKSEVPVPDKALSLLGSLAGVYQGSKWNLNLSMVRESAAMSVAQNPFSPLNFKGFTHLTHIIDYNPIEGGSYDFYTGKIGLVLRDGSAFFGEVKPQGLMLTRPSPGVLRPLLSQSPILYKRGDES